MCTKFCSALLLYSPVCRPSLCKTLVLGGFPSPMLMSPRGTLSQLCWYHTRYFTPNLEKLVFCRTVNVCLLYRSCNVLSILQHCVNNLHRYIYDRIRLKGRNFDRKFSHLLFCQTLIFLNFLSNPLFCQTKFNNVVSKSLKILSKFLKILSNSDSYLDRLLFCQSLQSCLTENF